PCRASALEAEGTAHDIVESGERAAVAEHVLRKAAAALEIVGEIGIDDGGDIAVENGEIDLVVQGEGAVIEIGGADDAPLAVDGHELGVNHGRQVVVDLGSGANEVECSAVTELVDEGVVDVRAGGQDPDLDASTPGLNKCAAGAGVGKEIGSGDANGVLCAVDEGLKENAGPGAASPRGADDDEAFRSLGRGAEAELAGAGEDIAGRFEPVFREGGDEAGRGLAIDAEHRVAPGGAAAGGTEPVVGYACTADEADVAVDDDELAMGALVEIGPGIPA